MKFFSNTNWYNNKNRKYANYPNVESLLGGLQHGGLWHTGGGQTVSGFLQQGGKLCTLQIREAPIVRINTTNLNIIFQRKSIIKKFNFQTKLT